MAEFDRNIQLDSTFTDLEYSAPVIPQFTDVSGVAPGGVVTTIDGDSGGGAVGPIVTFSAGVTGYGFQAVGTSVTMVLTSAATARTALGLSKNGSAAIPPSATDDSSLGYSLNSLWVDTALGDGYLCVDSTATAAVWKKIT
jgi:hypothetical protein